MRSPIPLFIRCGLAAAVCCALLAAVPAVRAHDASPAPAGPAMDAREPASGAAPPTHWWINANGRTGWLHYTVDPVSRRVEGVLLGKPVTGFLLDRRLILYAEDEGSYFWEGWIMRPETGVAERTYRPDYFIAGTFQQVGDVIFPWYGLAAGSGLPGGPGAGMTMPDNSHLTAGLSRNLNDFYVIRREGVAALLIVKGIKGLLENDEVVAGPLSYPDARRRLEEDQPPDVPCP